MPREIQIIVTVLGSDDPDQDDNLIADIQDVTRAIEIVVEGQVWGDGVDEAPSEDSVLVRERFVTVTESFEEWAI